MIFNNRFKKNAAYESGTTFTLKINIFIKIQILLVLPTHFHLPAPQVLQAADGFRIKLTKFIVKIIRGEFSYPHPLDEGGRATFPHTASKFHFTYLRQPFGNDLPFIIVNFYSKRDKLDYLSTVVHRCLQIFFLVIKICKEN